MLPDRPPHLFHDAPHGSSPLTAEQRLRYIRDVMARSDSFSAVPGWGMVWVGVLGLVAAALGSQVSSEVEWVLLWLTTALVAIASGTAIMVRKAHRHGMPLDSGAGRRFVMSLLPPFIAACVLTPAMLRIDAAGLLPGIWLLLYGAGTITGGAFSVRPVQLMGLAFMLLGSVSLMLPATYGSLAMGLGFGLLHIIFGTWIARRYGG